MKHEILQQDQLWKRLEVWNLLNHVGDWEWYQHWLNETGYRGKSYPYRHSGDPPSYPCLVFSLPDGFQDGPDAYAHYFVSVADARMLLEADLEIKEEIDMEAEMALKND